MALSKKAQHQKELKAEAKKYLSIPDLFPRSKPNFSKSLNAYQVRKIKNALDTVKNLGGEYSKQIVPMGRGRKKYMQENNLPSFMRGIFLSGGSAVNTDLKYIGGEVIYKRGGSPKSRTGLDTSGDEKRLIESAKKILKNRKGRNAAVTADGRVIGSAQGMRNNDLVIKEAVFIFNKYVSASDRGEIRTNGRLAAHPSQWGSGMGILFEHAQKKGGKKNGKKRK